MQCFLHPDHAAHGICKVCGRGVCPNCSADLNHSLVCKNRHEQAAEANYALLEHSKRVQSTGRRARWLVPAFFGFMGLAFVGMGWASKAKDASFLWVLGAGFVAFALALWVLNRRTYGRKPN